MEPALERVRRWFPALAPLLAALAYLPTTSRAVLGGDNGEFALLFARGGVAHPSGYPVYTLYLRALSWLPGSSPAHGAALATALLGVATTATLVSACRAWGASALASVMAASAFALSSLAWRLSTHAEVFACNALIAAAITLASAPRGPGRGLGRLALLGLLAGLGLGNHLSIVLLAPLGLYGVGLGWRECARPARGLAVLGLSALPGLGSYGWLVYEARHADGRWTWGDTGTLSGLVHHVLRGDYGTTSLAARGELAPAVHLVDLARHLALDLLVVPALLGLVGLVVASVGALRRGAPRGDLALVAAFLVAGPVFIARFNVALGGMGALVVERFYLLPTLLFTVFVARGADLAAARLTPRRVPVIAGLALAALCAVSAARALPRVRADHAPGLEDYLVDTLTAAPRGAVLLGTGDHRTLGFAYAQQALGLRPDVLHLDPWLLLLDPYRQRAERALGHALPRPSGRSLDTRAVALSVLATGRPLFLVDVFSPAIPRTFPTLPVGTLVRVLPVGSRLPPLPLIEARNMTLSSQYRWRPERSPGGTWQELVRGDYARPWQFLAEGYAATDPVSAARCARRASVILGAPSPAPRLAPPGGAAP